ncbi:MAG: hypothetical protein KKA84_03375 [Bacteroidetes bacterium]|nr:hypothetical protein [Bacteroidota bacterium]
MKSLLSIFLYFTFLTFTFNCSAEPANTLKTKLSSKVLNEERTIRVILPKEYHKSNISYNVLYILDGDVDDLLKEAESANASLDITNSFGEFIIVGIHTRRNRDRDMIPDKISSRSGAGGADKFLLFLNSELKPYIEKNYRTNGRNIIFGGSNGGLFVTYTFLAKPESFNYYIAASSMIGHNKNLMYKLLNKIPENAEVYSNQEIYFNYGGDDYEGTTNYLPQFYNELSKVLPGRVKHKLEFLKEKEHVPEGSIINGLLFFVED